MASKLDQILNNSLSAYWDELLDGNKIIKSTLGITGKDIAKETIKQLFQEMIDEVIGEDKEHLFWCNEKVGYCECGYLPNNELRIKQHQKAKELLKEL